jgi:CRISPR-associated protein Cas5d
MFHGFDYPEETGKHELRSRFWMPKMENGMVKFPRPEECVVNKFVRVMPKREYEIGVNMESVEVTSQETGL